jgi:hypothetical protein
MRKGEIGNAIASRLDDPGTGSLLVPFVALLSLLTWWNWRPDGAESHTAYGKIVLIP